MYGLVVMLTIPRSKVHLWIQIVVNREFTVVGNIEVKSCDCLGAQKDATSEMISTHCSMQVAILLNSVAKKVPFRVWHFGVHTADGNRYISPQLFFYDNLKLLL